MPVDSDVFRAVLGRFASGITVVTARDSDSADHGMTVSSFSSLSLSPPLILVSIGNDATMAPAMRTATTFAVNILTDKQEELSRRFAGSIDDRFLGVGHSRGLLGDVIFDDTLASMQCRIVARHPAGDHVIVVGEVEEATTGEGRPLMYYRGGYARLER